MVTKKHTPPSVIHGIDGSKKLSPSLRPHALSFTGEKSLTHSHFQDECDINTIMTKYAQTGILMGSPKTPEYGDFSSVPDYQTSLNLVITAQNQFNALPPQIRERFQNDPATFLDFCSQEENKSEMEKLGLLPKPEAEPAGAPPAGSAPEPPAGAPKTPDIGKKPD